MASVLVPWVNGLSRTEAEAQLDALLLRHVARFPFSATGDGSATIVTPPPGRLVPQYSIVTVDYPSILGDESATLVEGPHPSGTLEGRINRVLVHERGVAVGFLIDGADAATDSFSFGLYFDEHDEHGQPFPLPRTEWMRRGAIILSLAQRAFTNAHSVRLIVDNDGIIRSIEIFK